MKHSALVLALLSSLLAGCARHVVVEPAAVASQSSSDWTIKAEPAQVQPQR